MYLNNCFSIILVLFLFQSCRQTEKQVEERVHAKKPNVILIISDDQGYADYGVYSTKSDVETPNLDLLASDGVVFDNAYVTMSICSPSRCAILTGRQQQRWGVYNYTSSLPQEEVTLAEQLKDNGYATGMIGKSHYGAYGGPDAEEFPLNFGYDRFFGKEGGTMDYLRHSFQEREKYTDDMANHLGVGPWYDNDSLIERAGYSTDIITREALNFVEENNENPFFLTLSYNAVHLFIHQIPEADLKAMGLDHVPDWDPNQGSWEEYLEWYVDTVFPHTPQGRQRYLYHLKKLDDGIGLLRSKLAQLELLENTIIVYVSDNGGSPRTYSSNFPLRGNKYILEEGGIKVPMVMSFPQGLPKGERYENVVSALDIFPTLHRMLDIPLPKDREIDGVDLYDYITSKENGIPHETLYWTGFDLSSTPPIYEDTTSAIYRHDVTLGGDTYGWAIRHKDWKLRYFGETAEYALYDLSKDIGENLNLVNEHPKLVEQLKELFLEWHEEMLKEQQKNT